MWPGGPPPRTSWTSGASRRQQRQERGAVEKSLQGRNKLAQGGTRGGGSPGDASCGCPTCRSYVRVPTSHLGVSAIRAASSRRWLASRCGNSIVRKYYRHSAAGLKQTVY